VDRDREDEAAWGFVSGGESRIPAALGIFAALALYLLLPNRLTIGPGWVIPALEAAVLVPLVVTNPSHRSRDSGVLRGLSIGLIGLLSVANFTSLGLLIHRLLHGGKAGGRQLIYSAMAIWVTNVIVFGLWYWELDRGGPLARTRADHRRPDFLFPQMTTPAATDRGWVPNFLDYLYVAFTNATAFSPTDAMPLTPAAKALMLAQSVASVLVIVVVGARAVNILS
jgi:uncharacterized membrane protein